MLLIEKRNISWKYHDLIWPKFEMYQHTHARTHTHTRTRTRTRTHTQPVTLFAKEVCHHI